MDKRTSIPANALIWFGAGVSLAEILTGTFFAPLGFCDGGIAIVVGHIIGCALLFLAGLIGARTRRSAMETVKMAFGGAAGCSLPCASAPLSWGGQRSPLQQVRR